MQTGDRHHRQAVLTALAQRGMTVMDGGTVAAYVNQGRWLADCPCGGAELVERGELMVCGSCGARHEVEWPKNVTGIENTLKVRPPNRQNWKAGESLDSLLAENIEHGIFPEDLRKVIA